MSHAHAGRRTPDSIGSYIKPTTKTGRRSGAPAILQAFKLQGRNRHRLVDLKNLVYRRVTSIRVVAQSLAEKWLVYMLLLLELLYHLWDRFKEIRYQSDVCNLEYGSIWVL